MAYKGLFPASILRRIETHFACIPCAAAGKGAIDVLTKAFLYSSLCSIYEAKAFVRTPPPAELPISVTNKKAESMCFPLLDFKLIQLYFFPQLVVKVGFIAKV